MITEDRLRELAHVARSFAQKTAAASLGGGGVLEMRLVIQESIEILTLYFHAFII